MRLPQFAIPFAFVLAAVSLAGFFGFSSSSPSGHDCSPPQATDAGETENYLCDQQYALCTSAPCVPEPGDSKEAICSCDVEKGKNMATVPCDKVAPSTDANGIRTLYSTFSLEQFDTKKSMKCDSGTPWTNCLNAPCTVDPMDPTQAICVCDVMRTDEWTTLGGDCNNATCETGYWSGATIPAFESGVEFMTKALGLPRSPVKWCE